MNPRKANARLYRLLLDLLAILAAAILITLPIFIFGIPNGNDLPQHYQFAQTFYASVQNGVLYPSWADTTNYGFGDVGIRFYPPLAYYVLIAFETTSKNWFDASVLTFCFWFFLGGVGVYAWARQWFSERASLLAAFVYIFAPYHANQIYNAFTYAEFAAASIIPFCFLFVTRICRGGKKSDVMGLAVSYAVLVLTHLPMTVIGSLALLVYSLASLPRKASLRIIAKLAFSVVLGLLASAFYWVRMVTELDFLNHAREEFTTAAYDFHSNFLVGFPYVSWADYADRALWFGDLVLLITFGLFLPSAAIFYYMGKGKEKPRLSGPGVLLAISVFIATPLSLPIWDNFSPLQRVQFPWRWLAIISLSGTIFAAAGFGYLADAFRSKFRPLSILTVGFIIAGVVFTAAQVIRPANFSGREEFTERVDNLADAISYECWWTIWSKKEAFSNRQKVSAPDRTVEIEDWEATERLFRVSAGSAGEARIATFYYPYWQAVVNGEQVSVKRDQDGTILIPLKENKVEVRLYFLEPFRVKAANVLSGAAWLFFVAFLAIAIAKKFKKNTPKQGLPIL